MSGAPDTPDGRPPEPDKERIRGVVLRVTYENKENDYRVVKLSPETPVSGDRRDSRGEVVVVGPLPGLEAGETIEAEGRWLSHPRHGPQFKADWFKPSLPTGARGIEAYLSSGVIKGVGKTLAGRIVEAFGDATFDTLESNPNRLLKVKGISPRKLEDIRSAWKEARGDRELVTFLGEHGISPAWAARLRKAYGGAALSIVRSNPYRLAAEVRGVGFMRADAMARRIGVALDSPERVQAALGHILETMAGEGHTFLPRGELVDSAAKLLDLDLTLVEANLKTMLEQGRLTPEEINGVDAVFLNSQHEAETELARLLLKRATIRFRTPKGDQDAELARFEKRARIDLAPQQREAALTIARLGTMILTGGPGTGKTTTVRSVIELFEKAGLSTRLAAPTGRAARRLSETSKRQAETIHRLLSFQPHTGSFAHDETEPIQADLLIVDEVSMLDAALAHALVRALDAGTCLMLVGDEDQLPSVGPGAVLRDLIGAGVMPVVRLTEVFRQAQSSLIVTNAHRINRGEPPILKPGPEIANPDFFFIERDDAPGIVETIRTLVVERIPAKFKLDPIRDIQVLTPMRRGELGAAALNRVLQAALNKPKPGSAQNAAQNAAKNDAGIAGGGAEGDGAGPDAELETGAPVLRPGDRVMQTTNDYEKEVFNGDIGVVARVDADSGEVIVKYDDRAVSYLVDQAKQLALAYAITIHKSQGSEYRAVVIPVSFQHFIMLKRNLIYTALTRARDVVCLVGEKRALWRAIREVGGVNRYTGLGWFLRRRE